MAGDEDTLEVALQADEAWVRVQGRGSFKVSTALKRFAILAMEQGATRLLVDLGACHGMDSTFMGVLAGLALRLRKDRGELVLVGVSPKNAALVETLGLDRLVRQQQAEPAGAEAPAGLVLLDTAADKRATAETMLAAHEVLAVAAPGNALRFQEVLAYLRDAVRRLDETGTPKGV